MGKRIKAKSGRNRRGVVNAGMLDHHKRSHLEARIRSGITPGAEDTAVRCEVCGRMSDGYRVLPGRKEWSHGSRPLIPCVRRTGHIEAPPLAPGDDPYAGPVPQETPDPAPGDPD